MKDSKKAPITQPGNKGLPWGYRLEVITTKKGQILTAEGVKKVLTCRDTLVKLAFPREILSVTGEKLLCCTYASGSVELCGTLRRIEWERAEERVEKEDSR